MKILAMVVVAASFSGGPIIDRPLTRLPMQSASSSQASQDAADSLYRAGRDAFNKGDFARASELFGQVASRYPKSPNAGIAMYFQAFSYYRMGGAEKLRTAVATLTRLKTAYPDVARGDAATLRTRVCGELARQGDEACAAEVAQTVRSIERMGLDRDRAQAARDRAERDRERSGGGTTTSGRSSMPGCPDGDDDDDERVAALNALLQMDADRAMPILSKVLERRDACSAGLRKKAVFLVSQKRTAQTADILLGVARNDPDQEVREQAVFWLSQVPDERAVDMLQQILRSSNNEGLQNKALFALSQHRSGRGGDILREFAARDGASTELRGQAIFWLGQRSSAENNDFLRGLYSRLTNNELRERVLFSLSQRKGAGNERWLMDIAINSKEDIELRKQALFWAGQSGVGIDEIIPLYSRITDHEMKEQVIFVLSQRNNSPAAVDKLLDIAKNDKDVELRKKAIFWLGQSRDPRVQQFLLELINR
ncbi:MAG: HEAT repeat domain-containing protein [Gemmatimonadaceae bacterium]